MAAMAVAQGRDVERDCLVVGGGLAGLAAAHELVRSGRSVVVAEAEDVVGGRARTDWHQGRPVDRGFQAVFRGYRETRTLMRAVGLPRRDLRPVSGGLAVHDGERWSRLAPSPASLARFGALTPAERLRLARLGAEVATGTAEALLAGPEGDERTDDYLRARGFGEDALEGFFRPFFGAVFLDRGLGHDAAYFRFLLATLARGGAAIPSDGHGMIAEWTAAAVRRAGGEVLTGTRIVGLEADAEGRRVARARAEDGRALAARQVVLALDPPAARALLAPLDPLSAARLPQQAASAVTAAYALRAPLYTGRLVLLNAAPARGERPRVDLVCQTTNVTRPGTPWGPHVLLATSITTDGGDAEGLEAAVADLVRRWAPRYAWSRDAELLRLYRHRFAQFRPTPGVRARLPGPRTALENLILAGDGTQHPSIEGAVASGVRAAGVVDALLP
jgi:phytoene dehydrogenase-like protein